MSERPNKRLRLGHYRFLDIEASINDDSNNESDLEEGWQGLLSPLEKLTSHSRQRWSGRLRLTALWHRPCMTLSSRVIGIHLSDEQKTGDAWVTRPMESGKISQIELRRLGSTYGKLAARCVVMFLSIPFFNSLNYLRLVVKSWQPSRQCLGRHIQLIQTSKLNLSSPAQHSLVVYSLKYLPSLKQRI